MDSRVMQALQALYGIAINEPKKMEGFEEIQALSNLASFLRARRRLVEYANTTLVEYTRKYAD